MSQRAQWAWEQAATIVEQIEGTRLLYDLRAPLKVRLTLEIADALEAAAARGGAS